MLNGYKEPRIQVLDEAGNILNTYLLALCGEDGLARTFETYPIIHDMTSGEIKVKHRKVRNLYTLSYSQFSDTSNTIKILDIVNQILLNKRIVLTPRIDVVELREEVVCTNKDLEDIQLKLLHNQGASSTAFVGITLKFTGKYKVSQVNYMLTETVRRYGYGSTQRSGILET